jgi:hypothetical protein
LIVYCTSAGDSSSTVAWPTSEVATGALLIVQKVKVAAGENHLAWSRRPSLKPTLGRTLPCVPESIQVRGGMPPDESSTVVTCKGRVVLASAGAHSSIVDTRTELQNVFPPGTPCMMVGSWSVPKPAASKGTKN